MNARPRLKSIPVIMALFLPLMMTVLLSCAVNPVTGKRQLNLMSESQEVALGAQADGSISAQYGLLDDSELAAYVEALGQSMAAVSHRPHLDFHFRLLDDPVVNAFALPGGYVYITRGILAYLNSEAALAGVIGHEIGHVTARHGAQQYTQQTLMGVGLMVGSALSETVAQYADLGGTALQLLLLKYGRDHERQSDELGVQYASDVGYDTRDMAEFFRTLDRLTPPDGRLPSWASTHPDPGERHVTVLELSEQRQSAGPGPFLTARDAFLQRLDGLMFGPNPREGFVRDGIFHHPDMAFRFPVPAGWQLQNTRTQVAMMSGQQDALVIFTMAEGESEEDAAGRFVSQQGMVLLDQGRVYLGSLPAVRTLVRITAQDGSTQVVMSTFFRHGDLLFVFHGLCAEAGYTTHRSVLASVPDGFRTETDPDVLQITPVVLDVVAAPVAGTFAEVAGRYPIPAEAGMDMTGLALLNGMTTETRVERGNLLKTLTKP